MKALATALVKAQATIEGAKKDSTNPHFKNKYADLSAVWDACRDGLKANGLTILQFGKTTEAGAVLVTRLLHESGEFVEGEIPLLNSKGDMQGLGSALTYARRYGLAAMVGVCPEDDDGNAAAEKPKATAKPTPLVAPEGYDDWLDTLKAAADTGMVALEQAWKSAAKEYRQHFASTGGSVDALKAVAAKVAA